MSTIWIVRLLAFWSFCASPVFLVLSRTCPVPYCVVVMSRYSEGRFGRKSMVFCLTARRFATAPGKLAADGDPGGHGRLTAALLPRIKACVVGDQSLQRIAQAAKQAVTEASRGVQVGDAAVEWAGMAESG